MGDAVVDALSVTGVTPENGGDAANDTFNFYAGISPISNIQHIGLMLGVNVTIRGIVCADDEFTDVWIADAAGAWNGVLLFENTGTFETQVDVGDEITVVGWPYEFFTMTEIVYHFLVTKHSPGNTPWGPTIVTCAELDNGLGNDDPAAEPYEGCLVKILGAECTSAQELTFYEALVSDDGNVSQTIIDDDAKFHLLFGMSVGQSYDVTGVVMHKLNQYKVCPRGVAPPLEDIVALDVKDWSIY
jgi:hypothetical protein